MRNGNPLYDIIVDPLVTVRGDGVTDCIRPHMVVIDDTITVQSPWGTEYHCERCGYDRWHPLHDRENYDPEYMNPYPDFSDYQN